MALTAGQHVIMTAGIQTFIAIHCACPLTTFISEASAMCKRACAPPYQDPPTTSLGHLTAAVVADALSRWRLAHTTVCDSADIDAGWSIRVRFRFLLSHVDWTPPSQSLCRRVWLLRSNSDPKSQRQVLWADGNNAQCCVSDLGHPVLHFFTHGWPGW